MATETAEQKRRARASLELSMAPKPQDVAARTTFDAIGRGGNVPGVKYATPPSQILAAKQKPAAAQLAAPVVAAQPAAVRPQDTAGYALGNVAATGADYVAAPFLGVADAGNRAVVGTANVIRNAIGKQDLTPQAMNYTGFQDNLAAVRNANQAPNVNVGRSRGAAATALAAPPVAASVAALPGQPGAVPVAAPGVTVRPGSSLQPSGVYAAGVGAQGENVYDNTSIAKLNAALGTNVASQTNTGGGGNILPQAPAAATQLGAVVNTPSQYDSRRFQGQIDKQIKDLGALNMRSKRDLVGQLLGLKGNQVSGNQNIEANAGVKQAEINAGANSDLLASNTNQDISKRSAAVQLAGQLPQPTNQLGNDGILYQQDGTSISPITGADGKGFKPAVSAKESTQDPTLDIFKTILTNNPGIDAKAAMIQARELSGVGTLDEQSSPPANYEDFAKRAKAAGSKATDAELKAFYAKQQGAQ